METLGSCHCGGVRLRVPQLPDWVNSCNCSICSKLAWLVAYYPDEKVEVDGETKVEIRRPDNRSS